MSDEQHLKPWSLNYRNPEFEAKFQEVHVAHHGKLVRGATGVAAGLALAFYCMQAYFAPEIYLNAQMLVVTTVFSGVLALSSVFAEKVMAYRMAFAAVYLLLVIGVMLVTREFPPERRVLTYGFFISCVAVNGALPYDWRVKFCTSLVITFCFMGLSALDEIYDPQGLRQIGVQFFAISILSTFIGYVVERTTRLQVLWQSLAKREREKSDELLRTILPDQIAQRLKSGETGIVDHHPAVTVVFADLVGFTRLASTRTAAETAAILNDVFQRFDTIARKAGVEKVKTIGDAYMAVAGAPIPCEGHARQAADAALEMREALVRYRAMTGLDLQIRIGLHSGAVAAGIVGQTRFLYDFWGDTVNVASRMESSGLPGQIQVSATTAGLLRDAYELTPRRGLAIKGKGTLDAFVLVRPIIRKQAA